MSRFTPLRLLLATALTATLGLVMQPTTPAAAVDVYTTPGVHVVNGREWNTTCGKYSTTVNRCRTEIKATTVTFEGGQYIQKTGFVFNNLTYLPSPREDWSGNPLGNTGEWTTPDGRKWRTECDTVNTGGNGCRTWISATVIGVVKENPRTYGRITQEIFNNIVQFSSPAEPCSSLPIPAGFKVSVVNGKKIPHAIKTPYEPNTLYNPTSISNFTRSVLRNTTLKNADREKWDCLVDLGTTALMDGSTTKVHDGKPVRWFPYMFQFDASGTGDIPALQPGWISGLAQGAALGVMAELATATGDDKWLDVGGEVLNSFDVPLADGGFLNREEDFLWFEEYPTMPPTTVLNGHLEAIIGLDLWERKTGSQRARDLFNEAIVDLEAVLPLQEVRVEGGILTSYDLVRGYDAAPLRLAKVAGKGSRLDSAQLNGVDVDLPLTAPTTLVPNNILSPVLALSETGGADVGKWRSIAGPSSSVVAVGDTARIKSSSSWQGIQQKVPRTAFPASKPMTMSLDAKLTLDPGPGFSGRVAVYQKCDVGGTSMLFETQKPRGRAWDTYTMGFNAPPTGCDIWVQLLTSSYGKTGTTVEYKNISLREAEKKGIALSPSALAVNDLSIRDTPTVPLSLTGIGTARLEAYSEGQWQRIGDVELVSGTPTTIAVPERYTGRNLHYGYHETHVYELLSLYSRSLQAGFPASDAEFLRNFAARWEPMAPARHGSIPTPAATRPEARMAEQGPALDSYELPLVDPFQLLMEE